MTTASYLKVGDLASATGMTVRTLHYYDEIGLLSPSGRSGAGHRLYSSADVERLYRIGLLRRLGLRLDEVSAALDDPGQDLVAMMNRHIGQLDRKLAVGHRLRQRLTTMVGALAEQRSLDTRELLGTLEDMAMLDTAIQRRIPTLVYTDIEAAHKFLTEVFGLEPGQIARASDGTAVHAEVTAGDGVLWLHQVAEQFGLRSPQQVGACTEGMSIVVEDVDAHYRHAKSAGAEVIYEPTDQVYGYRDYSVHDNERHLWTFMSPLQ
ncbi:MerR family transcriptional regulator [Nocardia mexicana]|uniref:DNA-binding transcriptional MerR regulator n=1 Tax=Nocardia mexicana TaxID=279262 RepID=A0A370GYI6_9NOCA|nr:MerR family transcriptional regulator [Nocardia mexicana]RDI48559.1 DNA-binding transcriptional MerR regulator [Nocardia mexicana]